MPCSGGCRRCREEVARYGAHSMLPQRHLRISTIGSDALSGKDRCAFEQIFADAPKPLRIALIVLAALVLPAVLAVVLLSRLDRAVRVEVAGACEAMG